MLKFTEAQLEDAIIRLLGEQGYPHVIGGDINRGNSLHDKGNEEVLIKDDLRNFLASQYADEDITESEIETVIRKLEAFSALDLYESNKQIMKLLADGFPLKREPSANKTNKSKKDLYIYLIDYDNPLSEGEGIQATPSKNNNINSLFPSGEGDHAFRTRKNDYDAR